MSRPQSKFIVTPAVRGRATDEPAAATTRARQAAAREREARSEADDLQHQAAHIVPYLTRRFGLTFRGRILEIGAGAAWLSGALSKLPAVVEVVATDLAERRLKEEAPEVFRRLGANEGKITRMTGDLHRLAFPDNHFDFVVCAAVLNRTVNIVEALREARRVLKPGGWFVAVREPVLPRLAFGSAARGQTRAGRELYSLEDYERFFTGAGLRMESRRVNLDSGMKYFFNEMFNGLTHARYALLARKTAIRRGRT